MAIRVSAFEIVKESNNPLLSTHRTWQRIQLCEIAHVQNGYAFNSMHFNNNQKGVPIVRIRDVGKDGTETYYDGPFEKEYIVNKGDILVGMDGDFRCAEWRSTECLLNQRVCRIIPKTSNFNRKFLLICLQPYLDEIHKETSAVTVKHLSSVTISEIPLPLPPLPEQHRIVAKIEELFSDLDEGIASLKKAKVQLKTYRQSVLKWAFEGKLTGEWRKKNKPEPASELLKRIKEEREKKYKEECAKAKKEGLRLPKKLQELPPVSEEELKELQELPEGWNWVYLAGLGDLDRGKSKHRPRNDPKLFGGNYPFIQTGEVKAAKGRIRGFTTTYSDFGLQQSKLWPAGTLCITIAANIAETAFLEIDACFPDSIVGYKPPSESVESKYIRFFFEGNKSRIERFAPATAQKNINLNTLENLIVPFCTLEEQKMIVQEIETRLSVADNLEKTIDESLSKADALRQSILKQAFEGKLVPQDPNDEPAEKLLERIKKEKSVNDTEKPSKAKNKRKAAISA